MNAPNSAPVNAADVLAKLLDYFNEAHDNEVQSDHFGDGPSDCSYCDAISEAAHLLDVAGDRLRAIELD